MSQKKGVRPRHNNTSARTSWVPHLRVWYCYRCHFGPLNTRLDEYCASCGEQRCSFCQEGWVPAQEESLHDISVPRSREPRLEALLMASHVPRNDNQRAATTIDNTGTAISNIAFTLPPLLAYPQYQIHVIGTGTGSGSNTQVEILPQKGSELALEQWNVSSEEVAPVPIPLHEPNHDSLSPIELAHLPGGSSHDPNTLYRLNNKFHPSLIPGDHHLIQPVSGTTHSGVGALQNVQHHPVDPKTGLKRKHIAVDNSATGTSTRNSGDQPAQSCDIPLLSGGIDIGLLASAGWSEFPLDASTQFPVDSQIPNHSLEATPLLWVPTDNTAILSQPPSLGAKSMNTTQSFPEGRATKAVPRPLECCKSNQSPRFACQFYKYDPHHYIGCVLTSFNSIGHLRQHLNQKHKLGANHCKLCWRTFNTADALANHAQCCKVPTGGMPVDNLPDFPRIRLPAEKKWYWGWKKLFGEATALPPCPFFHPPLEDIQVQFRVQNPDMSHRIIGGEDEALSYPRFIEEEDEKEEEESSVTTSSDWQLTDDENLLTFTERIAGILSDDFNNLFSSSYITAEDVSPSTEPWDIILEN
ncbi:hypothetical protein GGR55DRAFT_622105 [Xylaria sp. FL0064]|nr:hypothetical protein GGR55DRAFT_622105 [Xylaria sp. FL0064]